MSAAAWRPFKTAFEGAQWFQRNCGHCRLCILPGRTLYPAEPCKLGLKASCDVIFNRPLPDEFFWVVYKRKPESGEIERGVILAKCKSRDYAGGRGRTGDAAFEE